MIHVILRNIVSQWGLYILNAGMLLGITPLLVHGLGSDAFGIWVIGGNTIAWMMILDFGIGSAVMRFGSLLIKEEGANNEELNKLFNSSLSLFFLIGLAAAVIALCIGLYTPSNFFNAALSRTGFLYFSLFLGLALTLNFWGQPFSGLLQAHQRFDLVNMVKGGALGFRMLAYVWLMFNDYSLIALAVVTLMSSALSTIAFMVVSKSVFVWKISFISISWGWTNKLFGYGWMMLVIIIADQLRFATDSIVIAAYATLSLVTVYAIGAALTTVFREIVGALVPIFVPLFSSSGEEEVPRKFFLVTRLFSLGVWGLGVLIFTCAAPFIDVWMGHYPESVEILYILMVGFLIASSQSLSFSLLYGRAKHFPIVVISIVDAIANLALSLWLVQDYGVMGVALGTAIPFVITYGLVFPVIVSRSVNISLRRYLREAILVPILFFIVMMFCVFILKEFWQPEGWVPLIAAGTGLLLLYIVLAWFTAVGKDGRSFLKEVMSKRVLHRENF